LAPYEIAARGQALYAPLREEFENKFHGKWIKFNLESGQYVIGDSAVACYDAYHARFPDGPSWGTQIGWHRLPTRNFPHGEEREP
jgi:hypothetical protein